jgi:NADH dehydrogenase
MAMPSWERKWRVIGDWVGGFFLGRDIASLDDRETPRAAFEAFASRPKPAAEAPAAPAAAQAPAEGQPAGTAGPAYGEPAKDVSNDAEPVKAEASADAK